MRDPAPAVTRNPHPPVIHPTVQLTAAAMLLHEGVKGSDQLGHVAYSIT
jgi:hypothetical protein